MRKNIVLKKANLRACSPRNAFYRLTLEQITDGYLVRKESGGNRVVLHREAWYGENLSDAEKLFARILKEKTNPNRKSLRKYMVVPAERIERRTVVQQPSPNEGWT